MMNSSQHPQCKLKLVFHNNKDLKTGKEDDVQINPSTWKELLPGTLVEVFHPEDKHHVLLLVRELREDFTHSNAISVEQSIANTFKLRQYKDVIVRVVTKETVTLDTLEIIFKDQYLSRSDFYRFSSSLNNTVVHMNKKLEYFRNVMRGQVGDMWCRGERLACGYVGPDTKIVFRSSTSVVHIFIQMSEEMWEFDFFGDLYFEKTIKFLAELFSKWNDSGCTHDVTIVLFSRIFYQATSIDQFPSQMRKYVQCDFKGRYYEDFYRVVVQNERYIDEWKRVLIDLKQSFNSYKANILNYQTRINSENASIPKTTNSIAAEGNFLETLNMTLNLYEYYNIDRNFDRTGKICVVITPGPGMFDVDRQLVNITKQRILDLGVGMDLVCMGDQPLHSVPLFKFIKKKVLPRDTGDDYYIPHWINHSFYRSESELQAIRLGNFIPRIKLKFEDPVEDETSRRLSSHKFDRKGPEFIDFDYHDSMVYRDKDSSRCENVYVDTRRYAKSRDRHVSIHVGGGTYSASNQAKDILSTSDDSEKRERQTSMSSDISIPCAPADQSISKSAESPEGHKYRSIYQNRYAEPRRALINPFAPNRLNIRLTANRRRWAHVFPTDKNGKPIQPHHKLDSNVESLVVTKQRKKKNLSEAWRKYISMREKYFQKSSPFHVFPMLKTIDETSGRNGNIIDSGNFNEQIPKQNGSTYNKDSSSMKSPRINARGKTPISRKTKDMFTKGEQKWSWDSLNEDASPINHMGSVDQILRLIGVDWKSLIIPACLPVTTDYFPNTSSLRDDFLVHDYQLVAAGSTSEDWIGSEKNSRFSKRRPLTTSEVFKEMVNQRLCQGFQIVMSPASSAAPPVKTFTTKGLRRNKPVSETYRFSIGRIFHTLVLEGDNMSVTRYKPKHFEPTQPVQYKYRLKVPDAVDYVISWTDFTDQALETFFWNYLDNYICTRGDEETYGMVPSLKYWRSRYFLLPALTQPTRTILEEINKQSASIHCDIYEERSWEEKKSLTDKFVMFIESLNKIKTSQRQKAKRSLPSMPNHPNQACRKVSTPLSPLKQRYTVANLSLHNTTELTSTGAQPPFTGPALSTLSNPPTPNERLHRQFTFDMDFEHTKETADNSPNKNLSEPEEQLTLKTPLDKIKAVMLDSCKGLAFLSPQSSLPEYSFSAAEAVRWVSCNVYGLNTLVDVIEFLQKMVDSRIICHLSGNFQHRFIHGAYYYYIVPFKGSGDSIAENSSSLQHNEPAHDQSWLPGCSNHSFQHDWIEVAVNSQQNDGVAASHCCLPNYLDSVLPDDKMMNHLTLTNVDHSLGISSSNQSGNRRTNSHSNQHKEKLGFFQVDGCLYKKYHLDIDSQENTDRIEWGTLKYQANYHPQCGFEMEIQWLVASGGKLGDIIAQWSRKAGQQSFLYLPVPCDPFALPYTLNSDPLRGPIFVPLSIIALTKNNGKLFDDFLESEHQKRLQLFQDAILKKFGFMLDSSVSDEERKEDPDIPRTYIHCTGCMFAMVPLCDPYREDTPTPETSGRFHSLSTSTATLTNPFDSSSERRSKKDPIHQEYIALQASTIKGSERVGFLWAWNFMLSKKARTASFDYEAFQDTMLADFRHFCSNKDQRLVNFWNNCKMMLLNRNSSLESDVCA